MLIEIRCEKFRESVITFYHGLNVVLGDKVATNSIGKSTLLMIIDFVYGGNSFLDHNKDVVYELGDHDYFFSFEFAGNSFNFRRGTYTPELVYLCDNEYHEVEPMSIDEYTAFLKASYSIEDMELSFRSVVSLFSRVWGKENLDVKHPLHSFKSQRSSDCITNTIKIFKKYESIKLLSEEVKRKNEEKATVNKSFKEGLIPKISKAKYKENLNAVSSIDDEIEEIKKNLQRYAVNIREIVNKEVLELKVKKDKLLSEKLRLDSRLLRVKNDLQKSKSIKSRHLAPLLKFFPEVDVGKLEEVELFHSKITKILRKELRSSEEEISESLLSVTDEIEIIDKEIEAAVSNIDNPNVIVDRVYELSQNHADANKEIQYFEREYQVKEGLKEAKNLLTTEKHRILEFIQNILNDRIRKYVTKIYNEERRSPSLRLGQNSYTFEVVEDTGTGKAYSNLVILDLAFLETTCLSFLIHDSVLFKNIQNDAVAKLIDLYEEMGKQTFIAIDEIQKYGAGAEIKLKEHKVIELDNENVLYIKDWRK